MSLTSYRAAPPRVTNVPERSDLTGRCVALASGDVRISGAATEKTHHRKSMHRIPMPQAPESGRIASVPSLVKPGVSPHDLFIVCDLTRGEVVGRRLGLSLRPQV